MTFGGMDIERQGLMSDHWQKQNKMKGEEKKSGTMMRAALMFIQRFLLYCCGLFNLCAHDGVGFAVAEDEDMVFVENLLAIGCWRLAMGVFYCRCGLGSKLARM